MVVLMTGRKAFTTLKNEVLNLVQRASMNEVVKLKLKDAINEKYREIDMLLRVSEEKQRHEKIRTHFTEDDDY